VKDWKDLGIEAKEIGNYLVKLLVVENDLVTLDQQQMTFLYRLGIGQACACDLVGWLPVSSLRL
jgi:hypothetical protein